jgi:LuxR family maltose regulon positive regulatory protein
MNGGKDFCEWSKRDKEIAKVLKLPVELVLGKYGEGLVNIDLGESAFEKSSEDDYEIMTREMEKNLKHKKNAKNMKK